MSVMGELYIDYLSIVDAIKTTNNGKILRDRLPRDARESVPALIGLGLLIPAGFMHPNDSVSLPQITN